MPKIPSRDGTGVVHQNVNVADCPGDRITCSGRAYVLLLDHNLDTMTSAYALAKRFQLGSRARNKMKVAPFLGEHLCEALTDTLRSASNEDLLTRKLKIHLFWLLLPQTTKP